MQNSCRRFRNLQLGIKKHNFGNSFCLYKNIQYSKLKILKFRIRFVAFYKKNFAVRRNARHLNTVFILIKTFYALFIHWCITIFLNFKKKKTDKIMKQFRLLVKLHNIVYTFATWKKIQEMNTKHALPLYFLSIQTNQWIHMNSNN